MGNFLPQQLAMATARTFGIRVHGGALKRGTAGTLLEQSFDAITVGLLAVASGITWFCHGGAKTWTLCAAVATGLALLAVGPSVTFIQWLVAFLKTRTILRGGRLFRTVSELQYSGILNTSLARRLVMLSALRFGTVVWMSVQTAEAVGLHIPAWQMAAAIPFVVFATIIAVTPGGIGLNELACAGALQIFGTPMAIGAQWALANRVLISASYFFVAACAAILLLTGKLFFTGARESMLDRLRSEKKLASNKANPVQDSGAQGTAGITPK